MAILSRRTCSLAIRLLAKSTTKTKLELLLYEQEVPENYFVIDNKEKLLLVVFQSLEKQGKYEQLLKVIQNGLIMLPPDLRRELQAALMRDGFVMTDTEIVADENRAAEHKTSLEQLVCNHADKLTSDTLLHHLKEAEQLFRLEKWDASIGQARNFVEQLLLDVANAVAKTKNDTPVLDKPFEVRNYLQSSGFFDLAERKKLVDGIYGYFSEEGSHPGASNQSTARVCLSILWTFGFYVLEKFNEYFQ